MSEADAKEFLKDIGLTVLMDALASASSTSGVSSDSSGGSTTVDSMIGSGGGVITVVDGRVEIVVGICRLLRMDRTVADTLSNSTRTMNVLMDMMEAPLRSGGGSNNERGIGGGVGVALPFRNFRRLSQSERDREELAQRQAVALVLRMLRCSDTAIELLKYNQRLRSVLNQIMTIGMEQQHQHPHSSSPSPSAKVPPLFSESANNNSSAFSTVTGILSSYMPFFSSKSSSVTTVRPEKNMVRGGITIADYPNLKTFQMARVAR